MLTKHFRCPVFAAFALLVLSFLLPGFRTSEQAAPKPDLVVYGQVAVVKLADRAFYYVFTIKNLGRADADLSNMKIKTKYYWDGYQSGRSDKYQNMRYDTPPNPQVLHPGEGTVVKMKVETEVALPTFFTVELFLDSGNSVRESNESNNRGNGNSIGLG